MLNLWYSLIQNFFPDTNNLQKFSSEILQFLISNMDLPLVNFFIKNKIEKKGVTSECEKMTLDLSWTNQYLRSSYI